MNMNAYEEYKTINHGKIQHHHRCESKVCWGVYRVISIYESLTASVSWYRGFVYRFESAWLLVQIPSPPFSMKFYISLEVALNKNVC